MSLAEKIAALTTPDPGFADPEQDQDVTAAKVTEFDEEVEVQDTDYLLSTKSQLRKKNADLAGEDSRYAGKKTSRKARSKLMGDEQDSNDDEDGEDIREHAAAELGHMFEGLGDDDDGGDSDEEGGEYSDNPDGEDSESGDQEEDESDEQEDDESGDPEEDESGDQEEDESDEQEDDESGEQEDDESGDPEEDESDIEEEVEQEDKHNEGMDDVQGDKDDAVNSTNDGSGFVFDADDNDFGQYGEIGEEGDDSEAESEDEASAEAGNSGREDEDVSALLNNPSVTAEVEKGKAVTRQLKVWDKLLETRIQQQKLLTKINMLPVGNHWSKIMSDENEDSNVETAMKEAQTSLKLLLNDLHYLEHLLVQGPECEPPAKKKKLADFSSACQDNHESYKSERNKTIEKWNDKTRITSGKNSFSSMETSTLRQIEQIMSNPDRLLQRTRLKRTNYTSIGRSGSLEESDPNIFDDDDFYHQLLRDLIDRKTNSSGDGSQMTRQWLEVQKLRSKLKKKVDTKASKGRKIRYDIHAKMVNFMAPVYSSTDSREETKNELFSSLFGGRKK